SFSVRLLSYVSSPRRESRQTGNNQVGDDYWRSADEESVADPYNGGERLDPAKSHGLLAEVRARKDRCGQPSDPVSHRWPPSTGQRATSFRGCRHEWSTNRS